MNSTSNSNAHDSFKESQNKKSMNRIQQNNNDIKNSNQQDDDLQNKLYQSNPSHQHFQSHSNSSEKYDQSNKSMKNSLAALFNPSELRINQQQHSLENPFEEILKSEFPEEISICNLYEATYVSEQRSQFIYKLFNVSRPEKKAKTKNEEPARQDSEEYFLSPALRDYLIDKEPESKKHTRRTIKIRPTLRYDKDNTWPQINPSYWEIPNPDLLHKIDKFVDRNDFICQCCLKSYSSGGDGIFSYYYIQDDPSPIPSPSPLLNHSIAMDELTIDHLKYLNLIKSYARKRINGKIIANDKLEDLAKKRQIIEKNIRNINFDAHPNYHPITTFSLQNIAKLPFLPFPAKELMALVSLTEMLETNTPLTPTNKAIITKCLTHFVPIFAAANRHPVQFIGLSVHVAFLFYLCKAFSRLNKCMEEISHIPMRASYEILPIKGVVLSKDLKKFKECIENGGCLSLPFIELRNVAFALAGGDGFGILDRSSLMVEKSLDIKESESRFVTEAGGRTCYVISINVQNGNYNIKVKPNSSKTKSSIETVFPDYTLFGTLTQPNSDRNWCKSSSGQLEFSIEHGDIKFVPNTGGLIYQAYKN